MTPIKCNKKYILIIYAIEFLIGIYISSVRLFNVDANSLINAFTIARETNYLDFSSDVFDMQTVISLLNIIICIPLIGCIFNRNYIAKCCFAATRVKKYSRFYLSEIINLFKYTVISQFLYETGIFIYSAAKCASFTVNTEFVRIFLLSVLNSTLILYIFVIMTAIVSVMTNDKVGIISMITVSSFLVGVLFIVPIKVKQYNPMLWYFMRAFPNNAELFTHNVLFYYAAILLIIIVIIAAGLNILKKKDVL